MKHLLFSLAIAALAAASTVYAGEEGFIYHGKKYVVYKDGEKVGKTFAELFPKEAADSERKPAAISQAGGFGSSISFQEHDDVRCFYPYGSATSSFSCVKFR